MSSNNNNGFNNLYTHLTTISPYTYQHLFTTYQQSNSERMTFCTDIRLTVTDTVSLT